MISRFPVFAFLLALTFAARAQTNLRFEVTGAEAFQTAPQSGRLLVAFSKYGDLEPRKDLENSTIYGPYILGRDVTNWLGDSAQVLDASSFAYPIKTLSDVPEGDYFVQALLTSNPDFRAPNAPGNRFSEVRKVHLNATNTGTVALQLSHEIPPEALPTDRPLIRFVKLKSELLSKFWNRPIYLRAGVVLPRDFAANTNMHYPLWVRIGGLNARYTSVISLMDEKHDFYKNWMAETAPRMILLQLDGAGPYGDPYQVNSANNGPYGDAITQELIPYIEKEFRGIGEPKSRVLSGLSTGGWASLALQIFYPDFFNGTWSYCPDGVDFRAFELINIYDDRNAYTNRFGFERPSERELNGDVKLVTRREVQMENVLGNGDSWTMSGGQWCAWNATYGPRGQDGQPAPLWDPQSGKIDRAVMHQWTKYDLSLILETKWATLGPKLQGKIHLAVGDADNYFLNNGVHLLDQFLSHAEPPYKGRIVYGPGKGHGWMDITTTQMMEEMAQATGPAR